MSVKKIYDKEHDRVKENAREAHKAYSKAIQAARNEYDMTMSDLTIAADAAPAQTYRVMTDPDANLTLLTMQRFAAPFGKKVVIDVVDDEQATEL